MVDRVLILEQVPKPQLLGHFITAAQNNSLEELHIFSERFCWLVICNTFDEKSVYWIISCAFLKQLYFPSNIYNQLHSRTLLCGIKLPYRAQLELSAWILKQYLVHWI